MINILPIVLHKGHMPVVTFFGPVLIIFWVFLLPINLKENLRPIKPNLMKLESIDSVFQEINKIFGVLNSIFLEILKASKEPLTRVSS